MPFFGHLIQCANFRNLNFDVPLDDLDAGKDTRQSLEMSAVFTALGRFLVQVTINRGLLDQSEAYDLS